jgi:hypothetical protein
MDETLRRELLEMARRDRETRAALAEDGSLFDGYHPRMEEVHRENAMRLSMIVKTTGWPGRSRVGTDAAEAAWLVVQHAIGEPAFQRAMLTVVRKAVEKGEADPRHAAMLEDRIRSLEGRPQLYGTQFDWDEAGEMSPYPEIEDPAGVDARRAAVDLPPLSLAIQRQRAGVKLSGEPVPKDLRRRRAEMDAWAEKTGWRLSRS